jgi:hypothetical protein
LGTDRQTELVLDTGLDEIREREDRVARPRPALEKEAEDGLVDPDLELDRLGGEADFPASLNLAVLEVAAQDLELDLVGFARGQLAPPLARVVDALLGGPPDRFGDCLEVQGPAPVSPGARGRASRSRACSRRGQA